MSPANVQPSLPLCMLLPLTHEKLTTRKGSVTQITSSERNSLSYHALKVVCLSTSEKKRFAEDSF